MSSSYRSTKTNRRSEGKLGNKDFDGRVALVTGAAQGIGAATSEILAARGAIVAVTDLSLEGAATEADRLLAKGFSACAFRLDVRDSAAIEGLVDELERDYGPISVAVNNAGLAKVGPSADVNDEDWNQHIDVMLTGPFKVSRTVGSRMLKRREGAIVNVCSIGAFGGHPRRAAYNAAKGGLKLLTEVLAVEWAPRGVRVNAVAPAVTRTEILANLVRAGAGTVLSEEFENRTPLRRLAEPREIAECIAFLASSQAGYITGETVLVDGGWLASYGFAEKRRADAADDK